MLHVRFESIVLYVLSHIAYLGFSVFEFYMNALNELFF